MTPNPTFQPNPLVVPPRVKQMVISPDFKVNGFSVDPWESFFLTDNKIMQTLSRITGFNSDPEVREWFPLQVDSEGRLKISPLETQGQWIRIKDSDNISVQIMENMSVPTGVITHAGVDLRGTDKKTILISTTKALTLYFQTSRDNVNWYTIQTTAGGDYTLAVVNAKEAFPINDATRYFRVLISNATVETAIVSLEILAKV